MTRGQFWFAMEYVAGTNLEVLAQTEPGPLPDRAGLPDGLPGAQGAGAGARPGVRAPRHQAREHPDRPAARGADREDLRLRPGQELPGPGPLGPDLLGRDAGHGPVHAPRADARLQDGAPLGRPLRHRRDALLPADLPVHLRPGGRGGRPDPDRSWKSRRSRSRSAGPTSPPAWPPSSRSAWPATPTTAIPPPPPCARRCGRSAEGGGVCKAIGVAERCLDPLTPCNRAAPSSKRARDYLTAHPPLRTVVSAIPPGSA